MKCPKCGFVQADYNEQCKKCGKDLSTFKGRLGIRAASPPISTPHPQVDLETARKAEQDRLALQRAQLELEKQRREQAKQAQEEARRLAEERQQVEEEQRRIRAERIALEAQKELEARRLEEERLKREKLLLEHEQERLRLEKLRLEAEREREEQRRAEESRRQAEQALTREKEALEQKRREEEEKRIRIEQERLHLEEERKEQERIRSMNQEERIRFEEEKKRIESARLEQERSRLELEEHRRLLDREKSAVERALEERNAFESALKQGTVPAEPKPGDFDFPARDDKPSSSEAEPVGEEEDDLDVVVVAKGGFFRRLLAGAVDAALIGVALALFLLVGRLVFSWDMPGESGMGLGAFLLVTLPVYLLALLLAAAYFTYFHASIGQTPGKKLFSLRVVDFQGQTPRTAIAFLRFAAGAFSLLFMGMGFFWIGLDLNKQGWHDKIAQTVVIRV